MEDSPGVVMSESGWGWTHGQEWPFKWQMKDYQGWPKADPGPFVRRTAPEPDYSQVSPWSDEQWRNACTRAFPMFDTEAFIAWRNIRKQDMATDGPSSVWREFRQSDMVSLTFPDLVTA